MVARSHVFCVAFCSEAVILKYMAHPGDDWMCLQWECSYLRHRARRLSKVLSVLSLAMGSVPVPDSMQRLFRHN